MWAGSWVSGRLQALGFTLPAYIGAMLVASVIRNVDDATRVIGLSQRTIDDIGNVALSLFRVLALMTLRLWELAGVAGPRVGTRARRLPQAQFRISPRLLTPTGEAVCRNWLDIAALAAKPIALNNARRRARLIHDGGCRGDFGAIVFGAVEHNLTI